MVSNKFIKIIDMQSHRYHKIWTYWLFKNLISLSNIIDTAQSSFFIFGLCFWVNTPFNTSPLNGILLRHGTNAEVCTQEISSLFTCDMKFGKLHSIGSPFDGTLLTFSDTFP